MLWDLRGIRLAKLGSDTEKGELKYCTLIGLRVHTIIREILYGTIQSHANARRGLIHIYVHAAASG